MLILLLLFSLASYFMPCKLTMNVNKHIESMYEEFKIHNTNDSNKYLDIPDSILISCCDLR